MKIIIPVLLLAAGLAFSAPARAHVPKQAVTTITGEIVDTGCYLGHEGQGAKHAECAARCINGGMPMAILAPKGTLYLVTMNHANPDPYNRLKAMAGKRVAVTGTLLSRSGMNAIDVSSFKPVR